MRSRRAFMMIWAMAVLTLVGTATTIFALTCRTLLVESNQARVEAASRNLTASAMAWARHNRKSLKGDTVVELDVEKLQVNDGELRVVGGEAGSVRIALRCRSGRINRSADVAFK